MPTSDIFNFARSSHLQPMHTWRMNAYRVDASRSGTGVAITFRNSSIFSENGSPIISEYHFSFFSTIHGTYPSYGDFSISPKSTMSFQNV